MADADPNPAEVAAEQTLRLLKECIDRNQSFRLEAGAGAGKTYSLVEVLRYLIKERGAGLRRHQQQVACITYTNVASDEIKSRTDGHPVILASTIHAFCWALIKDFQPQLRENLTQRPSWTERLEKIGGIGSRRVEYDLGYPRARKDEDFVSLHHDDVVSIGAELLKLPKFRRLLVSRFPVLLIDEYQDTSREFADALRDELLGMPDSPLIGLFGDHWQKIYDNVGGKIEHPSLVAVDKHANFRSVATIVEVLNRMRPRLHQHPKNPASTGYVSIFHTNNWGGQRRRGNHWHGDLFPEQAHKCLDLAKTRLVSDGWDFSKTKILMLTHAVLAKEQGYDGIAGVFRGRSEQFAKKEDPHLQFLVDTVEPMCTAFAQKKYGEMFAVIGGGVPAVESYASKISWSKDLDALVKLRETGTIGDVLDHLKKSGRPRLTDKIERREAEVEKAPSDDEASTERRVRLQNLKTLPYREVIALDRYIDGSTPFSTKHNVKGAEFENVFVVLGRGWGKYDFNRMLQMAGAPIPSDQAGFYEDNRNLFYVACSRPKTRLALLFTQELSSAALATLGSWFGSSRVQPLL